MMEQAATQTIALGLEHMPAFEIPATSRKVVPHLTQYLIALLSRFNHPVTCLELPSVTNLSVFFKCSHLDLYDALRSFRGQGYDYQFHKLDKPLKLWRKAPIESSIEKNGKRRAL